MFVDFFFFFNDTASTEIYTLSLHDALPIDEPLVLLPGDRFILRGFALQRHHSTTVGGGVRSEEHTSELQSPCNLVCRLLLEKKKKNILLLLLLKKKKKSNPINK